MQPDRDTREKFVPFVGFALLIAVVAVGTPYSIRSLEQNRTYTCENKLKIIGLQFRIYANEERGEFPTLSDRPGVLAPSVEELYPMFAKHLKRWPQYPGYGIDAFISPYQPNYHELLKAARSDPASAINDDSYWYLGYVVFDDEMGLAFVDAYRKKVSSGRNTDWTTPLETPSGTIHSLKENAWLLQYNYQDDEQRVNPALIIYPLEPNIRYAMASPVSMKRIVETDTAVRTLSTTAASPPKSRSTFKLAHSSSQPVSIVPLLIERPGLHKDGAHVLYHDGHVEFIEYPGKFPMTEKFIRALESLDELKEAR
ncbi:MAG: hypothetical protein IID08_10105 [Candidatus Hydrogenedentes bacterium]|nr:hypothetical protein [Candidatus Hydrogenedentota bacterium]